MAHAGEAKELFLEGYNCAQAMLCAYQTKPVCPL